MLDRLVNNQKLHSLFCSHARDFIALLHAERLHFSIACDTDLVDFSPPLTEELRARIGKVGIFVLSGYSFETLEVSKDFFSFEAGLILSEGQDVATFLKIPYCAVIQILTQNESSPIPIFLNPFEAKEAKQLESSMQAILAKNSALLKGRK